MITQAATLRYGYADFNGTRYHQQAFNDFGVSYRFGTGDASIIGTKCNYTEGTTGWGDCNYENTTERNCNGYQTLLMQFNTTDAASNVLFKVYTNTSSNKKEYTLNYGLNPDIYLNFSEGTTTGTFNTTKLRNIHVVFTAGDIADAQTNITDVYIGCLNISGQSCSDGIQNGNEAGVDCEGYCTASCSFSWSGLSVSSITNETAKVYCSSGSTITNMTVYYGVSPLLSSSTTNTTQVSAGHTVSLTGLTNNTLYNVTCGCSYAGCTNATTTSFTTSQNQQVSSRIPAFPSAEGYGKYTTGGRGGSICWVTNCNTDESTGSFKHCWSTHTEPRYILFNVSCATHFGNQWLDMGGTNVTLAGQTSPCDGYIVADTSLHVHDTSNVIIVGMKLRPGDGAGLAESWRDALTIENSNQIIIDHSSLMWSLDELFGSGCDTCGDVYNVTLQYSILANALNYSGSDHAYGPFLGDNSHHQTVYRNIIAHNDERNPIIKGNTNNIDIVNNIIFDFTQALWSADPESAGTVRFNAINNSLYTNISPGYTPWFGEYMVSSRSFYEAGNYDFNTNTFISITDGDKAVSPLNNIEITNISSASESYSTVLKDAGAWNCVDFVCRRDIPDEIVVDDVINKTHRFSKSQTFSGGYPTINTTCRPPTDSDADGMPDYWETEKGLNPNSNADYLTDRNGDGYNNLEEYLYGIVTSTTQVSNTSEEPTLQYFYVHVYNESGSELNDFNVTINNYTNANGQSPFQFYLYDILSSPIDEVPIMIVAHDNQQRYSDAILSITLTSTMTDINITYNATNLNYIYFNFSNIFGINYVNGILLTSTNPDEGYKNLTNISTSYMIAIPVKSISNYKYSLYFNSNNTWLWGYTLTPDDYMQSYDYYKDIIVPNSITTLYIPNADSLDQIIYANFIDERDFYIENVTAKIYMQGMNYTRPFGQWISLLLTNQKISDTRGQISFFSTQASKIKIIATTQKGYTNAWLFDAKDVIQYNSATNPLLLKLYNTGIESLDMQGTSVFCPGYFYNDTNNIVIQGYFPTTTNITYTTSYLTANSIPDKSLNPTSGSLNTDQYTKTLQRNVDYSGNNNFNITVKWSDKTYTCEMKYVDRTESVEIGLPIGLDETYKKIIIWIVIILAAVSFSSIKTADENIEFGFQVFTGALFASLLFTSAFLTPCIIMAWHFILKAIHKQTSDS